MNDPRRPAAPPGFVPFTGDDELDRRLIQIEDALKAQQFEPAVERANDLLRDRPGHAEARRLLAAALRGCGRDDEALALLQALAAEQPDNALIQNSLGAALRMNGELEPAEKAFRRAVTAAPKLAPAWYNLAVVLFMQDRVDEGLGAIDRVIDIVPHHEPALIMRSDMMREQGRVNLVTTEYRKMLARNPYLPWAWFGLANLKSLKFGADDLAAIQRALLKYPDKGRERTALLFAAAKALDDQQRYDEAFAALAEANANVRANLPWDAQGFSERTDATLAAFAPPPRGAPTRQGREVIFVVSLPRSGSTLTEQILASHSQVSGAGERNDLHAIIEEESQRRGCALAGWARDATPEDWDRLGKDYLQRAQRWRGDTPRFVDKMLGNWRFAGAIFAMLPEAKMVVCRRDPVETGFSCFRQLFAEDGHAYTYDLADMGAYWRDFDRMCRRWSELYPGRIYDMVYEELQADQEGRTRELLAFCGLEFEEGCLRFHETQRYIKTISSVQVRQPLRRDTAQAQKYGAHLDPLRAAVAGPAAGATAA
jgi:tetratricopeptide (TPR) repeat protein